MSSGGFGHFTTARAVPRLIGAIVAGILAVVACSLVLDTTRAALIGIAVCGGLFVVWSLRVLWPMDADQTRDNARVEDFPGAVDEVAVVVAASGGVVAVWALIIAGQDNHGVAALALVDVLTAWASVHLMYAAHYAVAYYADEATPGIDFNGSEAPSFRDFLYFSYNLGMTYQVSDTAVTRSSIRQIVLRQAVIAWLFGTAIVASTINFGLEVFAR